MSNSQRNCHHNFNLILKEFNLSKRECLSLNDLIERLIAKLKDNEIKLWGVEYTTYKRLKELVIQSINKSNLLCIISSGKCVVRKEVKDV